jgi:hypothetical protein
MLIDCDTCVGRGRSCGGCVVSILLEQAPMTGNAFRSAEQRLDPAAVVEAPAGGFDGQMRLAISVLLDAGLLAEIAVAPAADEQDLMAGDPANERPIDLQPVTLFGVDSRRQAS